VEYVNNPTGLDEILQSVEEVAMEAYGK
jgi:hypothetical protein